MLYEYKFGECRKCLVRASREAKTDRYEKLKEY